MTHKLNTMALKGGTKFNIMKSNMDSDNMQQSGKDDKLFILENEQLNVKSLLEIATYVLEKQLQTFKSTFYDRYKSEIAKMKKNLIDKNLKAVAIWEDFQNSLN